MHRPPAHIRAVAATLRATAHTTTADVTGLTARAGPATWEGPAADETRRRTFAMARTAAGVATGLRATAARLDAEAAAVEARDRAEAEARATAAAAVASVGRADRNDGFVDDLVVAPPGPPLDPSRDDPFIWTGR